jgi:acyltransferase
MSSSRHTQASPVFFEGLELMRAVLILLVIAGHAIVGPLGKEPMRYVIYSVHMPLFLALSGFVLNRKRLVEASWPDFFMHYVRRMLFAWLVAAVFFTMVSGKEFWGRLARREASGLLDILLYPEYHLWFIPVLFLQLIVLRLVERRLPPSTRPGVLLVAAAAAVFLFWNIRMDGPARGQATWINLLGDKRWILLFAYFYLGFFLRHWKPSSRMQGGVLALAALGLMLGAGIRFEDWKQSLPVWESRLGTLLPASALALFSFWLLAPAAIVVPAALRWLSEQSLFLYLWHVSVIRGAYAAFPVLKEQPFNAGEFGVAALAVLVLFAAWSLLHRFQWTSLWLGIAPGKSRGGPAGRAEAS